MRVDEDMIGSTIFYKKKKPAVSAKLSLVALMDIFTILVFFLLLNSGESNVIENAKYIKLPSSTAADTPHGELVIYIGEQDIWLDENKVASIEDVLGALSKPIDSLAAALAEHIEKRTEVSGKELSGYEKHNGFAVTIMGDRTVPYALLKTVMATCSSQNFRDVSLAVNQIAGPEFSTQGQDDGNEKTGSLEVGKLTRIGG